MAGVWTRWFLKAPSNPNHSIIYIYTLFFLYMCVYVHVYTCVYIFKKKPSGYEIDSELCLGCLPGLKVPISVLVSQRIMLIWLEQLFELGLHLRIFLSPFHTHTWEAFCPFFIPTLAYRKQLSPSSRCFRISSMQACPHVGTDLSEAGCSCSVQRGRLLPALHLARYVVNKSRELGWQFLGKGKRERYLRELRSDILNWALCFGEYLFPSLLGRAEVLVRSII